MTLTKHVFPVSIDRPVTVALMWPFDIEYIEQNFIDSFGTWPTSYETQKFFDFPDIWSTSDESQSQQQFCVSPWTWPNSDESVEKIVKHDTTLQENESPSKRRKTEETPRTEGPKGSNAPFKGPENSSQVPYPVTRSDGRVKGRRGLLKAMVELPLDTLHEIFRELEPIDLLHISWASRSLNFIIMEKSARYLWEQAFQKLYESSDPLPRCPDDLNLAQYARFLFVKNCMLCGSTHGHHTSWIMRLRACWNCLQTERFTRIAPRLVPAYILTIRARNAHFCLSEVYSKLKQELRLSAGSKDTPFLLEQKEIQRARQLGTYQFETWKTNRSDKRREELGRLQRGRCIAVRKKLNELGWTDGQLQKINIEQLPGINKAKMLTEREWKSLEPSMLARLQVLWSGCLKAEKVQQELSKRWQAFNDQFNLWVKNQAIESFWMPQVVDISVLEPFASIIYTYTESSEGTMFGIDEIDHAARAWMNMRNEFLFGLLPRDVQAAIASVAGDDDDGKPKLPPLACLFFNTLPFGFYTSDRINNYPTLDKVCQARLPFVHNKILRGPKALCDAMESSPCCPQYHPWNWDFKYLGFDTRTHNIAKGIIGLYGLDPFKATLSEMQEQRGKFKCTQCPQPQDFIQGWTNVLYHELTFHPDIPITGRWSPEPENMKIDGSSSD